MRASGGQTIGGQRRRKRIITNARKEQNRISQQLYRQRQRERAQNQESRGILPRKPQQLRPRQPRATHIEANERTIINSTENETAENGMRGNHAALFYPNTLQVRSQFLDSAYMMHEFIQGNELNAGETPLLSVNSTPLFSGSGMPFDAPGGDGLISQVPGMVVDPDDVGPFGAFPNLGVLPVTNLAPSSMLNTLQWTSCMSSMPITCNTSQYELLEEGSVNTPLCQFNPMQAPGLHCSQTCSPNISETPRNAGGTWLDVHLSQSPEFKEVVFSTSKFVREGSSSVATLPDAYTNLIESPVTTTLIAFFHNARCIGIEIKDLLNQKSPFYSPDTTITADPQALLAASRRPWLPTLLRPTLAQILIPHHPYLDLLPFPALRSRTITFQAATPQLFSPLDFKLDILKGGIYYHRSANQHGCQQPWDIRSWKVEAWFLTKWRLLAA